MLVNESAAAVWTLTGMQVHSPECRHCAFRAIHLSVHTYQNLDVCTTTAPSSSNIGCCQCISNDTPNADCKCSACACTRCHGTLQYHEIWCSAFLKSNACITFCAIQCNFSSFKRMGWKLHHTELHRNANCVSLRFRCELAFKKWLWTLM